MERMVGAKRDLTGSTRRWGAGTLHFAPHEPTEGVLPICVVVDHALLGIENSRR